MDRRYTLSSIQANKILINIELKRSGRGDKVQYGDHILPVKVSPGSTGGEDRVQIVFFQGQQAHPLRTWCQSRKKPLSLWPADFLIKDLERAGMGRVDLLMVQYDSAMINLPHVLMNFPDRSIHDYANQISLDLKKARIGEDSKFVVVCHSMGGLVWRHILVNPELLSQKQRQNCKGVIFVASPLNGSIMRDQVKEDLGRGPMLSFLCQ